MTEHDEKCEAHGDCEPRPCHCRERALEAEVQRFHEQDQVVADEQLYQRGEEILSLQAEVQGQLAATERATANAGKWEEAHRESYAQWLTAKEEIARLQTEASVSALQMQTENLRLNGVVAHETEWREHHKIWHEHYKAIAKSLQDELISLRTKLDAAEKVVASAKRWDEMGALKVMHVLSCDDCAHLEQTEDKWCRIASEIGRRQLTAARNLKDDLAAYDRAQAGEKP